MAHNPTVSALPDIWRTIAATLRAEACTHAAEVIERRALELENCLKSEDGELLSGTQAASASGYAADHLRRLVMRGELKNYGKKGAPRYRRADLPRKAKAQSSDLRGTERAPNVTVTREQIARAVITAT